MTQASNTDIERAADKLLSELQQQGFELVRRLPDGSYAALGHLLYTTAIYLGLNAWGYHRRFCFESAVLALQRFNELQSEDDEPQGYIARRPEHASRYA